jgi:hypothetical protein
MQRVAGVRMVFQTTQLGCEKTFGYDAIVFRVQVPFYFGEGDNSFALN